MDLTPGKYKLPGALGGMAVAGQPFNPLGWYEALKPLDPASRPRAILTMAHDNIGALLSEVPEPEDMIKTLRSWTNLDLESLGELAVMLDTPEMVTVRQALNDFETKLKDIEVSWAVANRSVKF